MGYQYLMKKIQSRAKVSTSRKIKDQCLILRSLFLY